MPSQLSDFQSILAISETVWRHEGGLSSDLLEAAPWPKFRGAGSAPSPGNFFSLPGGPLSEFLSREASRQRLALGVIVCLAPFSYRRYRRGVGRAPPDAPRSSGGALPIHEAPIVSPTARAIIIAAVRASLPATGDGYLISSVTDQSDAAFLFQSSRRSRGRYRPGRH